MENAYDIFSKEFDVTKQGFKIDHRLGGLVFSEKPETSNELFVNRKEEARSLAQALAKSMNHSIKKIIVTGEKGVGKSSLVLSLILQKQKKDKEFNVFAIPKFEYSNTDIQDSFARNILINMLNQIGDDREDSGTEFHKIIAVLKTESIPGALEKVKELGVCPPETKNIDEMIFGLLKKSKKQLIFIFDDYHILNRYPQNREFLMKMIDCETVSSIFILPKEDLNIIIANDSEFAKNSELIQVQPLSIEHNVELFARRIMQYRKNKASKIDYSKDVLPFTKGSLELLATLSEGNPLKFIKNCNSAYTLMSSKLLKTITENFIKQEFLPANFEKTNLTNLPKIQKEIYTILIENPNGISTEDIRNKRKKFTSPSSIIQSLNKLTKKGLTGKKRDGKNVLYFPLTKDQDITSSSTLSR